VTLFLFGRLAGYLLFAVAAWGAGALLLSFAAQGLVVGPSYIVLAVFLARYGFGKSKTTCAASALGGSGRWLNDAASLLPLILGFLTGLNMCPPFFLAMTAAVDTHSLTGSISLFFMFFLGTSLYVLPTPLLAAHHSAKLRTISKLAAGVVSVYYFYAGIVKTAAGIEQVWST
jgi:sulfite exporter TauE/SafE